MTKSNPELQFFSQRMSKFALTVIDRSRAFLYYYAVKGNPRVSLSQIVKDFKTTGLSNPNVTKLRDVLVKDRIIMKISKDTWQLKSDKIEEVEKQFHLNECFRKEPIKQLSPSGNYVNKRRFQDLKKTKGKYDFSRLLEMLSELGNAFKTKNYISVILLIRAILDHVPPIFGVNTFSELANNYTGAKSFKESMLNLENSSRKIADAYLHVKIRNKETLPNNKQVDFPNDLDVLLAEIVRIS
ncbi:MAG: hypothetical protein UV46_C0069G0004 [Candidatus Gottesmanbacteria bacterium GW2011_GWC2_42_8]|uniref:Uncharacterized protein n=1 Tax=Candidatus Gottesmanbacteria bacterium GW2011_GWA2_43_14 TaxID=1618443 RepID=A0A0G1DEX8_9BACT|nr:MAG: hypothetical protein UV46_C0069G0004 [Candidatus Gottesmanbacteria bacterium GW2011_GWC2_42_8]KKS96465.1 MAG: hypothetical protein UV73_C0010G0050 [Candidatus Gottesmanbacteria bacterium GW2011_GWA2_43_14]